MPKAIDRMLTGGVLGAVLMVSTILSGGESRPKLVRARPEQAGMSSSRLDQIDVEVNSAIASGKMPGCVVMIGRNGHVVFERAYGMRQVEPQRIPMTLDTVFDMASITKPVATATSVMILMEQGKLRLRDPVAQYISEFGQAGKSRVSVVDLLIHQGGFIPDNALEDYLHGSDEAFRRIYSLKPAHTPGSRFVYSDVGFIVLGELVRRLSGKDVADFSHENIFGPLGMEDTGYRPAEALRARAATTEKRKGPVEAAEDQWIRGEVHDPRAFQLGGVAGHAGLFSTANDVSVYAQMMLNGGVYAGKHVLSRRTVEIMTRPYPVSTGFRSLGWDMETGYSLNKSDLFSRRAFGHGGFTGTVLWIDPELKLFFIFLSNRVHPNGKGLVNPLAGRLGSIAVSAIRDLPPSFDRDPQPVHLPQSVSAVETLAPRNVGPPRNADVLTGIDVLRRDGFKQISGRRIGLITNHTGMSRDGISTAKLLHEARETNLVALFSPEHGFAGKLDTSKIGNATDPETGLPVFSLYGDTRKPTAEMLQGIDTLVFDIQDIGARFYTYVSTMGLSMKVAAEQKLRYVVLDRPNPINGVDVEGPVLDDGKESFIAFHRMPVRHGMTVGELAQMFRDELGLELDLEVIRAEGWQRGDFYDSTGLGWVNPSPNMRCLTQAIVYPGIGLLETTNVSVGRGTDTPFEVIGAPWLDGRALAGELNRASLAGVRFVPVRFTPNASTFQGQACGGVNIIVADRNAFRPLQTGFEIAAQLRRLYPKDWDASLYEKLLGNSQVHQQLLDGNSGKELEAAGELGLADFLVRRKKYLLYE